MLSFRTHSTFKKCWLWLVLSIVMSHAAACGRTRLPWDRKPVEELSTKEDTTSSNPVSQNPANSPGIVNTTLQNLELLQNALNLNPWLTSGAHCATSKIAIIDNGYMGLEQSVGKRLPMIQVEAFSGNPLMETAHGTKLAELIWALCTGTVAFSPESAKLGPNLKLYNGNGLTNFASAIDDIQSKSFDLVLYSQVWEYGGNFDGRGFINALVNKVARDTDTIWLNAAGNYGLSSWEGPVSFGYQITTSESPARALLPLQKNRVKLIVESEATPVKITAAWNDFTDDKNHRTTQDLDMKLFDYYRNVVAESKLIQDGEERPPTPGYSSHAREQINTVLGAGIYEVELTSINPAKFTTNSKVRIAANGLGVRFEGGYPTSSVMIPADNPNVFAVGASDFQGSSFDVLSRSLNGSKKPEFTILSKADFLSETQEKLEFMGTSSAAAMAAATLMIHASKCGKWTKNSLRSLSIFLSMQQKDLLLPKDPMQCFNR